MAQTPAQSPSFIHVHLLQNACQSEAERLFPLHRGRDKLIEGRGCTSALLGSVSHPPPSVSPPLQGRLEPWGGRGCQSQLPRHCPASLPGGLGPWIPEGHACRGREAQLSCSHTTWAQLLTGHFLPGPLPSLAHPLELHLPHQPHLESLPSCPF